MIDFVDGIDRFAILHGLTFADLTIRNNAAGTAAIIEDNTGSAIAVVQDIDASIVTEADFMAVERLIT